MNLILKRFVPEKSRPDFDNLKEHENEWHCRTYACSPDVSGDGTKGMIVIKTNENEYLVYGDLYKEEKALWYRIISGQEQLQGYQPCSTIKAKTHYDENLTLYYYVNNINNTYEHGIEMTNLKSEIANGGRDLHYESNLQIQIIIPEF